MVFQALETLSENFFQGFFRKRFGKLQPVEIAKKLVREMSARKTISATTVYVPNFYLIRMHPQEWMSFCGYASAFVKELEAFLEAQASERGYTLVGPVNVYLEAEENLPQGKLVIHTHLEEEVKEDDFPDGEWCLFCLRGPDEGCEFDIEGGKTIIGRNYEPGICLSDPLVSRKHAQIACVGRRYLLTDLGNVVGTQVNGEKVERMIIKEGDRIKLGETELEVRRK